MTQHLVDRKRWDTMSIFEQMGNIYSEVGRSLNAKRTGRKSERDQAIIRAIDLFDATTENLVKKKSVRLKEILRAKDQFLLVVYDNNASPKDIDSINRYFLQFAIAARINK
jgi:hypothetical protein